ncbi:hypothetical protein [Robertmurraya siralis]|uniref:hypothetical protein n=1 Tax=Robertmurraya siralis TaxID=77777 RepID=UPI0010F51EEB|nr:hypothetical protein [Robertmurraya siralis]
MAFTSGLFNSINGDRRYNAPWFASYFATFIGNGVFPNPSTGMQVIAGDGMQTVIKAGKAWINGYYAVNDDDYIMQHDIADGVLKRIDRIVLRLDFSLRELIPQLKKGAFASNPVAPTLQRDADAYEIALADVLINNGAISITQANITDLRLNAQLCGIVTGLVNQVDTTTIFNQYQSWFEEMTGEKLQEYDTWFSVHQQEFLDWFENIKDILDGDVAGNLLLLIEQNQRDIRTLIKNKTNVVVAAANWLLNSEGNRYEYVITDADITTDSVVDVNIQLDYLDYARMLLSACNSSNGAVTLYASSLPDADLVVDYRITRQVI